MPITNRFYSLLGDPNIKKKMDFVIFNITPILSRDDIANKIKVRYFAKYASQRDGMIYELDGGQYAAIQDNNLFRKTKINWIIRGRLQDIVLTLGDGSNILVKGVISQNQALLAIANDEVPGIMQQMQNHMEYWAGE